MWLVILAAPHITQDNPINISLSFSKVGSGVVVTGLDASEINASLTGGSLVAGSFAYNSGTQTFSFQVAPDADATEVNFELPAGAGVYGGSEGTLAVNRTIGIVPNVLSRSRKSLIGGGLMSPLANWQLIVLEIMMAHY